MATGRIDIELKASGAEALDIPNPTKAKTVIVPCLTQKKVKEVISDLHIRILQSYETNYSHEEIMVDIHKAFVWANKELQLKGE